jgi:hypothetical protein
MLAGIPAVIVAAGLSLSDYTSFLPGERQWCWEPAEGAVVGYHVEVYQSGLDLTLTSTIEDPEPCAVVNHDVGGEWLVRVQAFDVDNQVGPWSEWSEGFEVRPDMDCNGDGRLSTPDFNCFRLLYGQCLDKFGYSECPE